jgi:hypothetical protein
VSCSFCYLFYFGFYFGSGFILGFIGFDFYYGSSWFVLCLVFQFTDCFFCLFNLVLVFIMGSIQLGLVNGFYIGLLFFYFVFGMYRCFLYVQISHGSSVGRALD